VTGKKSRSEEIDRKMRILSPDFVSAAQKSSRKRLVIAEAAIPDTRAAQPTVFTRRERRNPTGLLLREYHNNAFSLSVSLAVLRTNQCSRG